MADKGICMKQSDSKKQASSLKTAVSNLNESYQEVMHYIDSFNDDTHFRGKAYSSARRYMNSVVIPAVKSVLLTGNSLAEDLAKIADNYASEVDSKDWSEKELNDLIEKINSQKAKIASNNEGLDASKDKDQIKNNNKQMDSLTDQAQKYEEIKSRLLQYNSTSASYLSGFQMEGKKVQLRQISCAIHSMSKGYQGKGIFQCKDTGWTKDVNSEWYSQYMHSKQRKDNEFWEDPIGNKVTSVIAWGLNTAGDAFTTEGKKKRSKGMSKCMEAGGITHSRTGTSQLKKGKKLGEIGNVLKEAGSIAAGDAIKAIPGYTEFTVYTTFKANYMENKMKGETDKQAATAAIGDTAIDEAGGKVSDKIDDKTNAVPGTASTLIDEFANNFKKGWNKKVEKYVY